MLIHVAGQPLITKHSYLKPGCLRSRHTFKCLYLNCHLSQSIRIWTWVSGRVFWDSKGTHLWVFAWKWGLGSKSSTPLLYVTCIIIMLTSCRYKGLYISLLCDIGSSFKVWRSWWPTFHGPVILPYILTIYWRNVIPGILDSCDLMIDLNIYLGQCDLYFMV